MNPRVMVVVGFSFLQFCFQRLLILKKQAVSRLHPKFI